MESGVRVQTATVTIGLCLPLLTASAAGNVSEPALRAAATPVDQLAMNDRRDSPSLPGTAALMLLNERVAFVARARDESPSASLSTTASSVAADGSSGEPHPLMMLLSGVALVAYVIGRRGIQRG